MLKLTTGSSVKHNGVWYRECLRKHEVGDWKQLCKGLIETVFNTWGSKKPASFKFKTNELECYLG